MQLKRVFIFIFASAIFTTAFASYDVNLNYGAKGPEVTKLQEFLIRNGLLNVSANGIFGPLTSKAVKAFQKKNNLPVTGYVGPMTRKIMNAQPGGAVGSSNATSTATSTGGVGNTFPQIQNNITQPLDTSASVSNSSLKVGDIVTFTLKINATTNHPIYTAGATVNYDPKVVSFVDSNLDTGWMPLSQASYWETNTTEGTVTRTAGYSGGLRTSSTFMTYKFKAISSGTTKIYLSKGFSLDDQNNDTGMEKQTVSVTIK
jgi:peptidoglycan hydrolase-like protein with peptidoglycan-binding domain